MIATICDKCEKPIKDTPKFKWNGYVHINFGITTTSIEKEMHFCSKECAIEFLKKIET